MTDGTVKDVQTLCPHGLVAPPAVWPDDGFTQYCRLCWRKRDLAASRVVARPPSACVHLGSETRRQLCPSCRGHVELKVFACAVHGECTQGKRAEGVKGCCQDGPTACPDKKAEEPPDPFDGKEPIRNLLYHIYPRRGNGVWQRNVGQLLRRIRLFNGRRVVAVLTGRDCDPSEHVRDQFAGHVHEFIEIPNNPALREVASFEPLFERVETTNALHVTFYGHAKGVTRPTGGHITAWTDMLYEVCLEYWPHVERLLRGTPLAGPFFRDVHGWGESKSDWHYSGSWFWFRNADLFKKPDWRRIDRFWSGIEPYLSLHFRKEEASCLFHAFHEIGAGLYAPAYLNNVVVPAWQRWKNEHVADRREFAPC